MNFLSVFFVHYFVLVIALSVFYFTGHYLFFFLRKNISFKGACLNYFSKTLLGVTVFITVYSIILTHFITVNLCFILIAALMIYEIKKNFTPAPSANKSENNFKPKIIFELLIVAFLLCGW